MLISRKTHFLLKFLLVAAVFLLLSLGLFQIKRISADDPLGSESNPFLVSDCTELQAIGSGVDGWDLDKHYALDADIDCVGVDFEPIGSNEEPFSGSLDGNEFDISNLNIDKTGESYVGLIASFSGTSIRDINLVSGTVTGDGYVGGLTGDLISNDVIISGITSNLDITATGQDVGGLIGYTNGSTTLSNIIVSADLVFENGYAGGLIGEASSEVLILDSSFDGNINVTTDGSVDYIGGLVGVTGDVLSISNSELNGSINVTSTSNINNVAGLVGSFSSVETNISNSSVTGSVEINSESAADYIAGIGGNSGNTNISNSFFEGTISITSSGCTDYVGGIFGELGNGSVLNSTNVYFSGDIEITSSDCVYTVGGLIGYGRGDSAVLSGNYFDGTVSVVASDYVEYFGGLVGYTRSIELNDSYFEGNISLESESSYVDYVGGIVGEVSIDASIINIKYIGDIDIISDSYVYSLGGHIGYLGNGGADITTSYFDGEIRATSTTSYFQETGGLIGYTGSTGPLNISNSYTRGRLILSPGDQANSTGGIGGIVGILNMSADISNTFSVLEISATEVDKVGGIIGYAHGDNAEISSSYFAGLVTGNENVGGLIGLAGHDTSGTTSIINSFSAGQLDGNLNTGAHIGSYENQDITYTGSYYDLTGTGVSVCTGQDESDPDGCSGVNSDGEDDDYFFFNSTMPPLSSWDFNNIWRRNTNFYPTLRSLPSSLDQDPIPSSSSDSKKVDPVLEISPVLDLELSTTPEEIQQKVSEIQRELSSLITKLITSYMQSLIDLLTKEIKSLTN